MYTWNMDMLKSLQKQQKTHAKLRRIISLCAITGTHKTQHYIK